MADKKKIKPQAIQLKLTDYTSIKSNQVPEEIKKKKKIHHHPSSR
jgi:hypothetical protein